MEEGDLVCWTRRTPSPRQSVSQLVEVAIIAGDGQTYRAQPDEAV